MTLAEIKAAVDAGKVVHWGNTGYTVERSKSGGYSIVFARNGSRVGLTWADGVTLNGKESDFFIGSE